jgi:hypothetical protein
VLPQQINAVKPTVNERQNMTHSEYIQFFERWLNYQFARAEDEMLNNKVLREVARIVADADDLVYWAKRDCWSMYDLAKQKVA